MRRRMLQQNASQDFDSDLVRLFPQGARLKGTLKGKVYRALVRPNGKIRFNGTYYKVISVAASAAVKRPTNGWWFWQVGSV
jgi:Restriction Enzyme Adenine Methylase Associated